MGLSVLHTGNGRADGVEDGALNLQGGHGPGLGSQLVRQGGVVGERPVLLHGVADDGQVLEAGQSLLEPAGALGVRLLQEPQKQVGGGDLEVDGNVEAVGVTVDDVKPAPAGIVGVRFIAGVDDGAVERGLQADLGLNIVGALADLESGVLTALPDPDPACTGDDGPGDEEGGQDRGQLLEGHIAPHEVVLVGAVGRTLAIHIVLVQDDLRRCPIPIALVTQGRHGAPGDHLTGAVPDQGVAGCEDLG
jgi:hypothetical protein